MDKAANHEALLEVKNLKTVFKTMRGKVAAVDGVSFSVKKGEIVGIVGESGCGKSVTSQSIMRLYDERDFVRYEGDILFQGESLLKKSESEMESIRGNRIAMIFQDALSSLNPLYTIGDQIAEAVMMHQKVKKADAFRIAEDMLRLTGIPAPEERVHAHPHEMSGGMRQRAMIAMALACQPQLLIADEPTTALDVTIQAQIMKLIVELNRKLDMGIMLITHDLGVVAQTCHRVIVMYLGHIVEEGTVDEIFDHPLHPYTVGLMKSIPTMGMKKGERLYMIRDSVPLPGTVKQGCRFCSRCEYGGERCRKESPELAAYSETQKARCFCAGIAGEGKVGDIA